MIWLLRGGALISSLLSSLPAWQLVDPLPVLARAERSGGPRPADGDDDEPGDGDSVERLFGDTRVAAAESAEGSGANDAAAAARGTQEQA